MNIETETMLYDAQILVVQITVTLLKLWFGGLLNAIL